MKRASPQAGLGIALIVLMTWCFATMDSAIRWLGAFLPVLLILWSRYLTQAVVMLVWLGLRARRQGSLRGFAVAHPRFQLLRGSLLLATSGINFWGVQHMPVGEYTAINMLSPVIVTLLAGMVLQERVTALRWALVLGGFAGALVMIRPGSGSFGWEVLAPLAGACTYACFQVLTAKLSGLDDPYTTHLYTGATGALLLLPVVCFYAEPLLAALQGASAVQLGWMLAIGLLGTLGHLLLILALRLASTATLMPFIYVQIGAAALIGLLAFDHHPDAMSWLGMGIISACGAASVWLNVRRTQR
ncbi:DMT family transporter [Roseateles sp. BYS180W]|uniref:DMT family transporter n=1 Tax=Roseateles rivi TaxID=3299028 RepID=A0ABW7FSG3_9BURK